MTTASDSVEHPADVIVVGAACLDVKGRIGGDIVAGTSNPGDRGRSVSHGCVRVYNDDLKKLLDVPLGTPVEIRA